MAIDRRNAILLVVAAQELYYKGCFKDLENDRAMEHGPWKPADPPTLTVQLCAQYCGKRGDPYSGLQVGVSNYNYVYLRRITGKHHSKVDKCRTVLCGYKGYLIF